MTKLHVYENYKYKKIRIIKLLLWCLYAKTLMLIKTDLINSSKLNKHSHTKYEQSLIY